jgi:hypothetical protein
VPRLISWNINQNRQHEGTLPWEHLWQLAQKYEVAAALLQEAPCPTAVPRGVVTHPSSKRPDDWQTPIPPDVSRPWCSAIVAFNAHTSMEPILVLPLVDAPSGATAASHPGQFSAAKITTEDTTLTAVSLYGLWE